MSGMSLAAVLSLRLTKIVVTPARVKLRKKSSFGVSCSVRSSRSVTCLSMSSTPAPGQAACTTMVLMTKEGSSLRPSRKYETTPAVTATIIRKIVSERYRSAHDERLKPSGFAAVMAAATAAAMAATTAVLRAALLFDLHAAPGHL